MGFLPAVLICIAAIALVCWLVYWGAAFIIALFQKYFRK